MPVFLVLCRLCAARRGKRGAMSAGRGHRTHEGTVLRIARGECLVKTAGGTFRCTLRGKLRKQLVYSTSKSRAPRVQRVQPTQTRSPVSVGDLVRIRPLGPDTGVIEEILQEGDETRGLVRQAPESKRVHVLAANVDQVVIVLSAAEPPPDFTLLDRYLVIAEHHTLPALIVLNKSDRGVPPEIAEELTRYERLGYTTLTTSALTGAGIAPLRAQVHGARSVFSGVSGVGKSSLINCLAADAALPTGAVDAKGEGRHVTTRAETVSLDAETLVMDTPGLRKLAVWNILPEDLAQFFPEIRALFGQCRFRDCTHRDEPACAVRAAADNGTIAPRRYRSYVLFYREFAEQNLAAWEQA